MSMMVETFEGARLRMLRAANLNSTLQFIRDWSSDYGHLPQARSKPAVEVLMHVHIARLAHPSITKEEKAVSRKFLEKHKEIHQAYLKRLKEYQANLIKGI